MSLSMRIGDRCLEVAKSCGVPGEGCEHVRVAPVTREDVEAAVRTAWARGNPAGTHLRSHQDHLSGKQANPRLTEPLRHKGEEEKPPVAPHRRKPALR